MFEGRHPEYPRSSHILRSEGDLDRHSQGLVTPQEITDIIERWCSTVGSHPECFPNLVNLLRTIGFSYISDYGISWLYSCIRGSSNPSAMLEQVCRQNTLPELLHNVWAAYHSVIKQDPDLQQKFIYIVDVTAAQGAPIALQLQRKIEEDIRRGG